MEPDRFGDRNEQVTPEVLDAALRAFWRGSARPIDRLTGGPVESAPTFGELLLLMLSTASTRRVVATMTTKRENR